MIAILTIGSDYGADRIGWQIGERLQFLGHPNVFNCLHPIDLLPYFEKFDNCTIIDAMWADKTRGTVLRIEPSTLEQKHCRSSHGLTLYEVIQLATFSSLVPARLTIYGIEIKGRNSLPFSELEVETMASQIIDELQLNLDTHCLPQT